MSGQDPTSDTRRIGRLYVILGSLREGLEWAFWLGAIIWWVDELAFSPLQLGLMGVVLSLTVLLSETPTGVVADMYSRKWSMAIGMTLIACSFAWAVSSRNFWVVLPAQAVFGLGWTFTSGADIAWLTDELRGTAATNDQANADHAESGHGNTDHAESDHANADHAESDHRVEQLLLQRHRGGMTVGAIAVVCMMVFARDHLVASVLCVAAVSFAVGVAWAVLAPEKHFNQTEERATFRSTLATGIANVRERPRLRSLVVMVLLISVGSEALDRFGYLRFIDSIDANDESIVVTGVLFLIMAAAGVAMNLTITRYIRRRDRQADSDDEHNPMVPLAILLTASAGIGALLTAGGPGVAVIGLGMMIQDSTRETLYEVINAWTNREVDSSARATVHSLIGQSFAVGEIAAGLLLGIVAQQAGIPLSLMISGCLLFLAASVALRTHRGERGPDRSTAANSARTRKAGIEEDSPDKATGAAQTAPIND